MILSRRALRILAWTAVVTLTLMLVVWMTGPYIVSSIGQKQMTELLGRKVTFGSVRIEPWELAVSINDLTVSRAQADSARDPQLHIARLRVDMDARSLLRLAPIVEGVVIDEPALHFARTGPGRYDFEDILARLSAQPADPEPKEPVRFALFNMKLRGGVVAIDDRPVGRKHELRDIVIELPFLSNLPADVQVKVQPRLAFALDGTRVDSGAESTPFAPDRASLLNLKSGDVDLAEWKAYWPAGLPLRPKAGHVAVDVALKFALDSQKTPRISLHGTVRSRDVALTDSADAPLIDWRALEIKLGDVRPLERVIELQSVRLEGPNVLVARDANGGLNLTKLMAPAGTSAEATGKEVKPDTPSASAVAATPAPAPASSVPAPTPTPAPPSWRVAAQQVDVTEGKVHWEDATTRPATSLAVQEIAIQLHSAAWPMAAAIPWKVSAKLSDRERPVGAIGIEGEARPELIRADATLDGVALSAFDPYLSAFLKRRLEGELSGRAQWRLAEPFAERKQEIDLSSLVVNDARLVARDGPRRTNAGDGLPSLRKLEVADAKLLPDQRRVSIGRVALTQPSIELARDAKGALNVREWLVAAAGRDNAGESSKASPKQESADGDSGPAWSVSLGELALDGGRVRWSDAGAPASAEHPVRVAMDALKLNAKSVAWPASGKSTVALSTRLRQIKETELTTSPADRTDRPGRNEAGKDLASSGRIEWKGDVTAQPLAARGRLLAERLPVHAFEPYVRDAVPVDLRRADAGFKGTVDLKALPAGWQVRAEGDARVTDLQVNARPVAATGAGDELLSWQALEVPALRVQWQTGLTPTVETGESTLTDLFAKLLITEQGRLNLSDVGSAGAAGAPSSPPGVGVELGAAAKAPPAAVATAAAAAPSASASSPASSKPAPVNLTIAGVRLVNGHVDFTDHFVRPNYSAALTELNGRLGTFRTGSTDMAPLELTGRAAGTALLDVRGSVNPTAKPLALDIRAKASDLELAPLSPYAGKYAGYAIERGKLTMDLHYTINPDGSLAATNQVVLNQLTFGERVESPDATTLPVRLAVALLKDRNGVIDINLPISGSLNDPQFSFGGLIIKVIVNLLVKAITAPFSLLTGGSEQSNTVEFSPGTAVLAASAADTVNSVGKALTDRPNLQLTVAGAADATAEREAMQQAAVDALVQAQWRKERLRAGQAVEEPAPVPASADAPAEANAPASGHAPAPADVPASAPAPGSAPASVPAAERDRIVREIYKDTKLPNKPRNLVGWPKDIPVPEMETMLRNAQPVSADLARELALRRGIAVRDALVAKGVASERLFLAAPKLRTAGEGDAAWKPTVELTLAPR